MAHSLEVLQALSRDKASLMFARGKNVEGVVRRNNPFHMTLKWHPYGSFDCQIIPHCQ